MSTPRVEQLFWIDDGFSQAEDQVGRPVTIDGKTGKVIAAQGLTITVKWDPWWQRLLKRIFRCQN